MSGRLLMNIFSELQGHQEVVRPSHKCRWRTNFFPDWQGHPGLARSAHERPRRTNFSPDVQGHPILARSAQKCQWRTFFLPDLLGHPNLTSSVQNHRRTKNSFRKCQTFQNFFGKVKSSRVHCRSLCSTRLVILTADFPSNAGRLDAFEGP